MRSDPTGQLFFTVLGAAVGAVAGYINGKLMGTDPLLAAKAGAVSGAIAGLGIDAAALITAATGGVGAGLLVAGISGAISGVLGTGISSKWHANGLEYVENAIIGGAFNLISFGLAPINGEIVKSSFKNMASDLWKTGLKNFADNAICGSGITVFGLLCGDATSTFWAQQQMERGNAGRRNDGYSVSTRAPR